MGYRAYGIPQFIFNYEIQPDNAIDIPRGMRRELLLWADERRYGIPADVEIVDDRTLFPHRYIDSASIKLRDYQSKALTDLLKGGPEGLLVSKAGSGKTVMGLSLVAMFGQPTLWLTHTIVLLEQAFSRISEFLPNLDDDDLGMIRADKWKIGKVFTVATIQSLVSNRDKLWNLSNNFGMVIVDECHHVPATTFTQVVSSFNPFYLYGLTATPIRRDGLSNIMVQTMGQVSASVSPREINEAGGIVVPKVYCRNISYEGDDTLPDNLPYQKLLRYLQENDSRNEIIVKDVLAELAKGNVCIVLTERKAHAETLHEKIKSKYNKVSIATGNNTTKVNRKVLDHLSNGSINCLVATSSLLGEGFDEPKINRAFLCLPIRNEVRTEQIVGRIQRPSPHTGKTDAIIYDYIDTHSLFRHQFKNFGDKGCRYNVYKRLDCKICNDE